MNDAEWSGTVGVALLLLAFVLNLTGVWSPRMGRYQAVNFLGATLACYSAVLLAFWPFIVLEGVWACSALIALVRRNPAIGGS